jgi:glutaredoxin
MKHLKLALAIATTATVLLGPIAVQAQAVYRIVGPDGKVTFSDKAPVAASANVTARSTTGKPVDVNPQNATLSYELRQVVARYPVTLYSGAGCVPCNAGRLLLQGRGIPYTEYTVSSPEDAEALQRISGDKSLPFLTVGSQKIKGYSEAEWTQFLNAASYPPTSRLPGNFSYPAPKALVSTQKISPVPDAAEAREAGEAPTVAAPSTQPSTRVGPSNPAGIKF